LTGADDPRAVTTLAGSGTGNRRNLLIEAIGCHTVRLGDGYQQGSIFGAVIVAIAFAAAFSTVPRAIDNPPTEKPNTEAKNTEFKQREKETFWERTTADPVATYTFFLALVALAQAGLFVWQLIYMRRGIDDAGISAVAAKKAADAAVQQVAITRTGTATTERAYVFCEHIDAIWTSKYGAEEVIKWSFTYVWRNSGKTPTQYAIGNVNKLYDPNAGDLPFDFAYPDYGKKERISIGPNAIMHSMAFDVTPEDLQSKIERQRCTYGDGLNITIYLMIRKDIALNFVSKSSSSGIRFTKPADSVTASTGHSTVLTLNAGISPTDDHEHGERLTPPTNNLPPKIWMARARGLGVRSAGAFVWRQGDRGAPRLVDAPPSFSDIYMS
jgi:hypothetical protein